MAIQHEHWISPEEYLEIDRASLDVKYEYIDGHMYAMSGGTIDHAQIAMNLIRALADHFQGRSCRVFSSDVRVQVAEKKYFYPDVTVSCNPEDWQQGNVDIIRFPRLAIEVLSPSTEARDRRKKSVSYQACPTVQEYALINTQYQMVEIFRRHVDGNLWLYHQYGPSQEAKLASVKLTIPLAEIYRLTDIPELEAEEQSE
jgi:Uma2 family endonuclease